MLSFIGSLIIATMLQSAKAEAIAQYPGYRQQIEQVGMPSVGYRERLWFNWKVMRFQAGRCDLFSKQQVVVVRDKNLTVTLYRLKHEFRHFVAFAAGLPLEAHERIDR